MTDYYLSYGIILNSLIGIVSYIILCDYDNIEQYWIIRYIDYIVNMVVIFLPLVTMLPVDDLVIFLPLVTL
jgi:hypothetical protein